MHQRTTDERLRLRRGSERPFTLQTQFQMSFYLQVKSSQESDKECLVRTVITSIKSVSTRLKSCRVLPQPPQSTHLLIMLLKSPIIVKQLSKRRKKQKPRSLMRLSEAQDQCRTKPRKKGIGSTEHQKTDLNRSLQLYTTNTTSVSNRCLFLQVVLKMSSMLWMA